MDPLIWKHLPSDLIRTIVLLSKPSIDVLVAFRLPPRKIHDARTRHLDNLLWGAREGLVYHMHTNSLHIFRIPGHHLVRRPVKLDMHDEWMTILNQDEKEHILEITQPDGKHYIVYSSASFVTELPLLLKDS